VAGQKRQGERLRNSTRLESFEELGGDLLGIGGQFHELSPFEREKAERLLFGP
jgi:hypothetical protein